MTRHLTNKYMIHRPTDNVELCAMIPNCKFIPYSQLWKLNNVNDLLPRTLILYELAEVGHWCCIFLNDEGLNFFDPLSGEPDSELDSIHDTERKHKYHQDFTYLLKLLAQSNKPIVYNEHQLQKYNTATCGMWCLHRMMHDYMTNDEYYENMKKIKNKDLYVAKYFFDMKKNNNIQ